MDNTNVLTFKEINSNNNSTQNIERTFSSEHYFVIQVETVQELKSFKITYSFNCRKANKVKLFFEKHFKVDICPMMSCIPDRILRIHSIVKEAMSWLTIR